MNKYLNKIFKLKRGSDKSIDTFSKDYENIQYNTSVDLIDLLAKPDINNHKLIEKPKNEYGLEIDYVEEIKNDILVNGNITDGSFLYKWDKGDRDGLQNGAVKYDSVEKSNFYKENIVDIEHMCVVRSEKFKEKLKQSIINKKSLIELGAGNGKKTVSYLKDIFDIKNINSNSYFSNKSYESWDISGKYVEQSTKAVRENLSFGSYSGIIMDWIGNDYFNKTKKKSLYDSLMKYM